MSGDGGPRRNFSPNVRDSRNFDDELLPLESVVEYKQGRDDYETEGHGDGGSKHMIVYQEWLTRKMGMLGKRFYFGDEQMDMFKGLMADANYLHRPDRFLGTLPGFDEYSPFEVSHVYEVLTFPPAIPVTWVTVVNETFKKVVIATGHNQMMRKIDWTQQELATRGVEVPDILRHDLNLVFLDDAGFQALTDYHKVEHVYLLVTYFNKQLLPILHRTADMRLRTDMEGSGVMSAMLRGGYYF